MHVAWPQAPHGVVDGNHHHVGVVPLDVHQRVDLDLRRRARPDQQPRLTVVGGDRLERIRDRVGRTLLVLPVVLQADLAHAWRKEALVARKPGMHVVIVGPIADQQGAPVGEAANEKRVLGGAPVLLGELDDRPDGALEHLADHTTTFPSSSSIRLARPLPVRSFSTASAARRMIVGMASGLMSPIAFTSRSKVWTSPWLGNLMVSVPHGSSTS